MYKRILVPLDGSETAERGLTEAIALARSLQARLFVLHVVNDYPLMVDMSVATSFEDLRDALRAHGQRVLAAARTAAQAQGVEVETAMHEIKSRDIADTVIDEVRRLGCDLVVMGTHGRRGMSHLVFGSDAEAVLRICPVPVLLVRPNA